MFGRRFVTFMSEKVYPPPFYTQMSFLVKNWVKVSHGSNFGIYFEDIFVGKSITTRTLTKIIIYNSLLVKVTQIGCITSCYSKVFFKTLFKEKSQVQIQYSIYN